jgi:hypothetical protein
MSAHHACPPTVCFPLSLLTAYCARRLPHMPLYRLVGVCRLTAPVREFLHHRTLRAVACFFKLAPHFACCLTLSHAGTTRCTHGMPAPYVDTVHGRHAILFDAPFLSVPHHPVQPAPRSSGLRATPRSLEPYCVSRSHTIPLGATPCSLKPCHDLWRRVRPFRVAFLSAISLPPNCTTSRCFVSSRVRVCSTVPRPALLYHTYTFCS